MRRSTRPRIRNPKYESEQDSEQELEQETEHEAEQKHPHPALQGAQPPVKLEGEDDGKEPPNSEDSDSEDEGSPMVDENGEPLSERITTSTAIKIYKVTRHDLDMLDCELRKNPHYRSAAPMRLYKREEVMLLGKQMKKTREAEEVLRKEQAVQRAAQRKLDAKHAADEASRIVANFTSNSLAKVPANSGLSAAWQVILPGLPHHLSNRQQMLGAPGVRDVMASLVNLALTCEEMNQQVIDVALPALAEKVDKSLWELNDIASGEDGRLPPFWDKILCAPKSCTLTELKEASKQLKLPRSGTKDELILRVYAAFRMKKLCPKSIPAAIAIALRNRNMVYLPLQLPPVVGNLAGRR